MLLRQYLIENRITITEFAERVGVSRNYLNQLVLGNYKPGKSLAKVIESETQGLVKKQDFEQEQQFFNIHQ